MRFLIRWSYCCTTMSNVLLKLDRLDRRLLLELDRDARQSYAALSRSLHVPEETVRYHTENLCRSGVIRNFFTVIDAGKLGNSYYKILIKLHNVNEARVEEIIKYLIGQEAINWIARMDGAYDIGLTIRVHPVAELSLFLDDLRRRFYRFINRLVPAINIQVDFFAREYLTGATRKLESNASYSTPFKLVELDQTDLRLLEVLSKNCRLPATEIAKNVGVSAQTIQQRLQRLRREKIIKGYRLILNHSLVGFINYYVLINLNYRSQAQLEKFTAYCRALPHVNYFIKAVGEWDFELNVEVESVQQYRSMIMDLTRQFSDIVRDYQAMTVSEVYKLTLTP